MASTLSQLIDRAFEGLSLLEETAAPIDEELQYVADLGVVWGARLRSVADGRGAETAAPEVEAAIEMLVAEAAEITDPHRAIDWLSTLPQVALAALGEAA